MKMQNFVNERKKWGEGMGMWLKNAKFKEKNRKTMKKWVYKNFIASAFLTETR